MGKMSKNKGKRGEREVAKILTAAGFSARRGVQYKGTPDSPDVIAENLPIPCHFEVKRTETLSIYKAYEQAKSDSGADEMPIVCHRRNRQPWLVIFSFGDFINLLKYIETLEKERKK